MEIEEAKRRARQGPVLLLARRGFAVLIGLASTITISHLVSPQAYGLANMSAVLLAFAQVFRDFGLTSAVLRKGTISQTEMSFIFWFNAATTIGLTILIAVLSPLAGAFYREPIVTWVVLASVIGFLINGLSLQHRSLMNRDLRFAEMAWIDSLSLLIGFLATLGLAAVWHDVWSIVFGTVLQSFVNACLYVLRSGWIPGRPRAHEDVRDLLKFGANTSIFSIAVFFSGNAAPLIIGHWLGPWSLGQFNRAQALFTLPTVNVIQPITQATMPLLTRLRSKPLEYRQAYLELVSRICTVLMPASALLSCVAVPLVETMLGERWHMAGVVLSALAPSLAAVGLGYSIGDLFTTQNRAAEMRNLGLTEMALRLVFITIGARYGLLGAAVGFSISSATIAVMRLLVAGRTGPVTSFDQFRAAASGIPLGLGTLAAAVGASGIAQWARLPMVTSLVVVLLLGSLGALGGGLLFGSSRRAMIDVLGTFGIRARRRRKAKEPAPPVSPPELIGPSPDGPQL